MDTLNFRKRFIFIVILILFSINFTLFSTVYAKESVLLIRPLGYNFKKIEKEFRNKVESLCNIEILPADKYLKTSIIAQKESQIAPKAVILIDVNALKAYKKYRSEFSAHRSRPTIILLPKLLSSNTNYNLENSIAIKYYVSIPVSVKKLEKKIQKKVKNIGIIYHSKMLNEIRRNITYSHKNQVYTQHYMVEDSGLKLQSDLKKRLNEITANNVVDVFWIPNDPQLTTPYLVKNLWKPFFEKTKIMSIVLDPLLLPSNGGFGTMYIRPDYNEIGRQTGDLVKDLIINNVPVTELNVDSDRFFYCSFSTFQTQAKQQVDTLKPVAISEKEVDKTDTIAKIVQTSEVRVDSIEKNVEYTSTNMDVDNIAFTDQQEKKSIFLLSNKDRDEKVKTGGSITPEDKKNKQDTIKKPDSKKESSITSAKFTLSEKTKESEKIKKPGKKKEPEITKKSEKKKTDKTQNYEVDTPKIVKTDEIEPVEELLSGIFLEITDSLTSIYKYLSDESSKLGTAQNGERFPIVSLDETGMWYKIQFYNDYGWVNSNSVKIVRNSLFKQYLTAIFPSLDYILLIGVIAIILIILFFIFIQFLRKKNTLKTPSGNSCMVVTRNFDKIPYSDKKDFSIPLHKFFKKFKFDVVIAKDLKTVKETLMHYVPNVICVDWQFEVDIRSDIQKMLLDISLLSDVIIIFYNAIDSFHFENEVKFARTFYFGTSFTLEEIQEVIYPLLNGKKKTENDTAMDNYLTGKISNYNLVEIFQLLGSEKKTGCLIIECDVPVGLVFFNNSRIIYAITNDLKGEKAVFKILKLKEGMFRFVPNKKPISTNMDHDIFQVLLEWTTTMDKETQGQVKKTSPKKES